jgi:iron complex transport system ATP-binding protein
VALVVKALECGYGQERVVHDLNLTLPAGNILAVLGPNGVGKTTLFKAVLGFIKPTAGTIELDGRALESFSRSQLARALAYVPQNQQVPFSFTVEDVVLMGRAPHLRLLEQPGPNDRRIAYEALEQMGVAHLARKTCTQISGGERQMVFIARALAQQPRYLVMDEPTASLDYGNQVQVLERILELAGNEMGILLTTHDPTQAFTLKSDVVLMQRGFNTLSGYYREVLTEQTLRETYGVDVVIGAIPWQDKTLDCCMPLVGIEGHRHIK